MQSRQIVSLSVLAIFLLGCAVSLYIPTENDAKKYNSSLESLNKGRELYVKKCGRCHKPFSTTKFTEQQWLPQVNRMQKRAKVTNEEKELIFSYIKTHSK
jgi:hypothetical protein